MSQEQIDIEALLQWVRDNQPPYCGIVRLTFINNGKRSTISVHESKTIEWMKWVEELPGFRCWWYKDQRIIQHNDFSSIERYEEKVKRIFG